MNDNLDPNIQNISITEKEVRKDITEASDGEVC